MLRTRHDRERGKPSSRSAALFLFASLLLFPGGAGAQVWKWKVQTVDVSTRFSSIAVDSSGNVHIAYSGDKGSSLNYAFQPAGSTQWFTMQLDKQLQEHALELAIDPQGNPQICYTPRELKYAHFDGRQWSVQRIAEGEGSIEYNCTLVVATDGKPHVLWYQTRSADGSNFYHLRYAVLLDGVWMARTVDFDREAGKWNALILDDQGNPHIFYSAFPPGDLKSGYWDGKKWDIDVKFSPTSLLSSGMGISVVRTPEKNIEVSFYESPLDGSKSTANGSLKFARLTANGWTMETVDSVVQGASWVGYRSSVVLDKNGNPHISYEDHGTLKHAYWDGKRWHIQVVAPRVIEPYLYSSMAIDKDDVLRISYRDPSDGSLKVAVGRQDPQVPSTATVQPDKKD
jgi:hypothetical protein